MEYNISREEGRFSKYAFVVPTHNLVEVPESTDKVVDGLNSLMQELQHKYPYLRFLQKAATLEDGAVQRVYVYMKGQLFTMGAIAYGDYREGDQHSIKNRYYMWSPHVRDMRVRYTCPAMYSSSSTTVEKAVGKAKYLRPHTNLAYLFAKGHDMIKKYGDSLGRANNLVGHAKAKITDDPLVFWDDLFNGYKRWKSGLQHEYSAKLVEKLEEYISKTQESTELLAKRTDYVAQVIATGDHWEVNKVKLSLLDYTNSSYSSIRFKSEVEYFPIEEYTDETLPRSIAGKVSMLDMLQKEEPYEVMEFVLGVGITALKRQMYYVVL